MKAFLGLVFVAALLGLTGCGAEMLREIVKGIVATPDVATPDVATPDINVTQGAASIPTGSGSYDYQSVLLNVPVYRVFTVQNVGAADLNLTATPHVELSGADVASYSVEAQPPATIAAGASATFTIKFVPNAVGTKTVTVTIRNNDPDEATYTYTVLGSGMTPATAISKTGQTTSYTAGDDGDLKMGVAWPIPRLTDNADGTITDNLTGLMWEKTPSTTDRTFYQALDYANNLVLAAHSDWYLPNIWQLISFYNIAASDQIVWLTSQGFDVSAGSHCYRSATTAGYDDSGVWDIHLQTTWVYGWHSKTTLPVQSWAVRNHSTGAISLAQTGQQISYGTDDDGSLRKGVLWPTPRFVDNGDGTVSDNLTGLIWEKSPDTGMKKLWSDAISYANNLSLAGHSDWRLPNLYELESLRNAAEQRTHTRLNQEGFDIQVADWTPSFWTSTTFGGDLGRAFIVDLGYGGIYTASKPATSLYVIAVRSSP
jgi:hypothetical protein